MEHHIKSTGEQAYFAASNSRGGFHSYYEHCFRGRVERLYCIKGGPGTGKSTLMRTVARRAEACGYRAEYYYCSSDANSLDAVLLYGEKGSIGLLDATAPHAFEPVLPAVREEIIDLGQFWDTAAITSHKDEIVALGAQKSGGYRAAYRHLCGYGEVSDALSALVEPCLNVPKLDRVAERLMRGSGVGTGGEVRTLLSDSVGMGGHIRLDSYVQHCERLCLIEDYHDTAYALTRRLYARLMAMGSAAHISYHPILPDRVDAMLLTASGTAFAVCTPEQTPKLLSVKPEARLLSMRRMMDATLWRGDVQKEARRLERLRGALLDEAGVQLGKVAAAHFALEDIYTSAMDFEGKEKMTEKLCEKLFH